LELELAKANPALLGTVVLALGQLDRGVPLTRHVAEDTGHFFLSGVINKTITLTTDKVKTTRRKV
jgi:hypothetical protein